MIAAIRAWWRQVRCDHCCLEYYRPIAVCRHGKFINAGVWRRCADCGLDRYCPPFP